MLKMGVREASLLTAGQKASRRDYDRIMNPAPRIKQKMKFEARKI